MRNVKTLCAMLVATWALALAACSVDVSDPETPEFKTKLAENEIRNSAFKPEFPLRYETYLRNNESEIMTEYGGSVAYNKKVPRRETWKSAFLTLLPDAS